MEIFVNITPQSLRFLYDVESKIKSFPWIKVYFLEEPPQQMLIFSSGIHFHNFLNPN